MTKIYDNITELIGQTPIVKLQHVPAESADVYVKLEAFNPGGSVKDRIALAMIRAAEADGRLKPGGTMVLTGIVMLVTIVILQNLRKLLKI